MRAVIKMSAVLACSLAFCGLSADDFIFGACTHRETVPGYLNVLSQSGVDYVRDHATWNRCEDEKGKPFLPSYYIEFVDKAKSFNLKTLNILCYSNKLYDNGGYPRSEEAVEAYVKYAETTVRGFKGKCNLYQIWNEWDGGCGMPKELHGTGDPASYMKLLAATYPRIKAIDPDAVVISNSVCTGDAYLKDLIKLDLMKHCDAIGLHTYNYSKERTAEKWYERMQGVDKFIRDANGGKSFPVYITEMGWPTHCNAKNGSSEEYSADSMAKLYLFALTMPFIKGVWWYEFRDGGLDNKYNEDNFGMVRPDLTPKKSFFVMRDLTSLFKGAAFVERIDVKDPDVWLLKYKAKDGRDLVAAWTSKSDVDYVLNFSMPASSKPDCTVTALGYGSVNTSFFKASEKSDRTKFQMTVRNRPYVLGGKLDALKIDSIKAVDYPVSELKDRKLVFCVPSDAAKAYSTASGKTPVKYKLADYVTLEEKLPRADKGDLDASFTISWTKDKLFLNIEVIDDVHFQEATGSSTWKGDGVQMAFSYPTSGAISDKDVQHIDLDIALTKTGAMVYRQYGSKSLKEGEVSAIKTDIQRDGNTLTYKLEIPTAELGLPDLKAGAAIGFSILVNDHDGKGRKGFLRWGDGIGTGKDPALYKWIIMED